MRNLWCTFLLISALLPIALLAANPPAKNPVPSPEAQRESQQTIDEVYKSEIAQASSAEQKSSLSKRLLKDANDTKDDAAGRYILLSMAREMAASAGDVETALSAVSATSNDYQLDFLPIAASTLTKLARTMGPGEEKRFILHSNGVIDDAISADRYEVAEQVAGLMILTAQKKTHDPEMLKRAEGRRKEIEEISAAFGDYTKSLAQLKQEPADPEARLRVGRFICFMKGDWDHGLPVLAVGSDPVFKKLAAREISGVVGAASQLAVADEWWECSEKAAGVSRTQMRLHSARRYREASPGLSGLQKVKADARVREVYSQNGPEWVDLLPLVDPARYGLRGRWEVHDGKLRGGNDYHAAILLPIVPRGDFRIRVGFRRLEGNADVAVLLPVGVSRACFVLSSSNGAFGGLDRIKDRPLPAQRNAIRPCRLENGRRYELEIQVRTKDGDAAIDATLDGKAVFGWKGLQSDLNSEDYIQPNPPALGLGGFQSVIEFDEVTLRMLGGTAEPIGGPRELPGAPAIGAKGPEAGSPDIRPRSPKAVAAIAKYDQAAQSVNDHFDQAIADASKQLLTDLAAAKKRALDSMDLEEAQRIEASTRGAAAKPVSPSAAALADWIVRQRIFIYDLHDGEQTTRTMEFLPGGAIGNGSGQREKRWSVTNSTKGPVLVISSESGSCQLFQKEDGTFVGVWERFQIHIWCAVVPAPPDPQISSAPAELPKSPAAQSALTKFDTTREQLQASRTGEITAATVQLTADLAAARADATLAQDLQEIARIDNWKNRLQVPVKSKSPAPPDLRRWIADRRIFFYEYRFHAITFNKIEFLPDGRIGAGSGAMESRWDIANSGGRQVLHITGDGDHPGPCVLFWQDDESLAGQWPRGGPTVIIRIQPLPPNFNTDQ